MFFFISCESCVYVSYIHCKAARLMLTKFNVHLFKNNGEWQWKVAEWSLQSLKDHMLRPCHGLNNHLLVKTYWLILALQILNNEKCIAPLNVNLPLSQFSFVHVIRFKTNRKYAFFCIYHVRLSPDNIALIHWIKIDHVLL